MTLQNTILKCPEVDELLVVEIVADLSDVHQVDLESKEIPIVIHDRSNKDYYKDEAEGTDNNQDGERDTDRLSEGWK